MKALTDRRVQVALVALVAAVGAVYGLTMDETLLAGIVGLLAGAAGGLLSRAAGDEEATVPVDTERKLAWLDHLMEEQAKGHAEALLHPLVYPDDWDDEDEENSLDDWTNLDASLEDLRERVAALEASRAEVQGEL